MERVEEKMTESITKPKYCFEIIGGANDGNIGYLDDLVQVIKVPVRDRDNNIVGFDICQHVCISKITNRLIYQFIQRLPPK